ncbi:hypothetical protein EHS25_004649 [Saitozyma podzolica]|uniref:Eukaryotic translation initiation factor 2A n=1 Tax=Saitozyma podzolica TaxID=1890683 RepID=A0A427YUM3_9TREE|nr:hypothetical protein EHS25_004649 [Saitozyma podzolica]
MSTQYAFRAQKASGVADGPSWQPTAQVAPETSDVRCYAYSPNGEYFAYALASGVHLIPSSSSSSAPSHVLPAPAAVAAAFSPLSKTLFTFERPVKSDTDVHKNVRAWDVVSGEEVAGWHQKTFDDWEPIITQDESYLLRPSSSDLLVFSPPLSARPSIRLKGDAPIKGLFLSSPAALPQGTTNARPVPAHSEPAVAVWLGEKKGAPARVQLYPLSQLVAGGGDPEKTENRDLPTALARKAFYKADKLSVKWNKAGTMALFLTHTDVDATGKSYYGETNLYLVSLDGSFDGLVDLDKEGPIYDFCWSPTSREFSVCYGYMPARTQLFDSKAKPVHSFGSQHRNVLLYQPQGKLLLSAGFGNLAGGVDVWDVSTRQKVAEFKASNSSSCEWSPCGRYIMTATLSPRLRVDNGIKIWWCGGQLLHIHPQEHLYQASFRPVLVKDTQPFPAVVPQAPEPNESVALYRPKGEVSNGGESKPAGAYRPPGARGTLASDAYRRDDEASSGASTPTPMFKGGKPAQRYVPGHGIPGAGPPGSATPGGGKDADKKKRVRSKRPLKDGAEGKESEANTPAEVAEQVAKVQIGEDAGAVDEAVAKKVRNLTKKLKAIEDLKDRIKKGDTLEKTQLQKIEGEAQIRSEIEALGGSS